MAQILSENLTWTIDGLNTQFTFSATPTTVINVFVDGAEVFPADYTIVTDEITFDTAPLYSVRAVFIVGSGFALNWSEILLTNETPAWVVNNSNITFTTSNMIYKVLSLVIDGVETTDFVFSWNVLTTWFAPDSNILIDYITSSDSVDSGDFTGNSSQAKMIARLYTDILKEDTNSTVFKLETSKEFLSEIQSSLLNWDYVDMWGNKYKRTNYTFLKKKQSFTVYQSYASASADSSPSQSLEVLNNEFTSGFVQVNGDVFGYSSNVSWVLSWLSGRSASVKSWDRVYQVFKLDILNFKSLDVKRYDQGVEVSIDYADEYRSNEHSASSYSYTIVNDYYGNKYLKLYGFYDGETVVIEYQRKVPNITETINSIMPWDYGVKILPYLVASRHLFLADEFNKAQALENIGITAYAQLQSNYTKDVEVKNDTIESESTPYYY